MSSVIADPAADPLHPTDVHPAFEWQRSERIESLNLVIEEYRHSKTGALYYHLAADNPENVFLVALRTVPTDSRGVAHILEHTALCGSKHYPVRDPFFMMIRRSLNTFMNAFTSSDWTAYPFASQNRKDFNNLLDVYLDAVFFSRLHELDFAQEGHRLEFAEADNPDSDLVFKGVVFNEMKGAMSSPSSILWHTLTKYLFPTTTYHYNSGGDPEAIPDLSYRELKSFYRSHYHPSNAVFMTYGNIPAAEHQQRIHDQALSHFEPLGMQIDVEDEKRYYAPLQVQESYAYDEPGEAGDKTHIVIGWLLGPSINLKEQLEAHLLEGILLDDGASPLRYALETTNLGSAPSPLCGLEASNREMSFVCGLEGSKAEHAAALETLVLDVLQKVADEGVPTERVEAVLHQLELSQREVSGDGYPYGLQLILEGLSSAIHRGDPVAVLNLDPVLDELRELILDPDYVRGLVKTRLLDNAHRVRLTLVPDSGLSARREQAEAQRLAAIKQQMDKPQRLQVVQLAEALAARQQEADDPALLPKVGLEDIPAEMPIASGDSGQLAGRPASFYAQGTNGLVYQQLIADLPNLDDTLLQTLPYYTNVLTDLGCAGRDYLEVQALQTRVSGGVHASSSMRGSIDDAQRSSGYFILSGKALVRNHSALSALMRESLLEARFDELSRIRELMAQQRARREQGITGNGHSLAMLAAMSGLSGGAALSHRLRGLASIHDLKVLDDNLDTGNGLEQLAQRFEKIHQQVLAAPRQFLLVAEAERLSQAREEVQQVWANSDDKTSEFTAFGLAPVQRQVHDAWLTNTQVNFCAKAYPAVAAAHEDAAALSVLAGFLRNGYLHRSVREQGGAYGGGASYDSDSAAFRFFSYRDPRLEETLNDFDRSVAWLLGDKHEWRLVEEAILGVVSSIDRPGSPAGEAKDAFFSGLYGRTPERRRIFRQRVLEVTLADLQRVGETYLKPEAASVAVISSPTEEQRCRDLGLTIQVV
ncbi:Predicted insulinase-like Zn-dependent peptidase DVU0941 [hydrothermal vent metagenome]|uniref:Predicted insulinase-like Zn-dependent peptidase DVU0941 n=1 Tax=hydrothermal vent metagenome TaxID=652676 RepID=A0A3B0ZQW7_9ZZZZ